jgi:integrase/recombinase XerD
MLLHIDGSKHRWFGDERAVQFFFAQTLKRPYLRQDFPYPKLPRRLPVVLSQEEVGRLIDSANNLAHRAMLMTLYSTGLHRSEVARLKVSDIDSQRNSSVSKNAKWKSVLTS